MRRGSRKKIKLVDPDELESVIDDLEDLDTRQREHLKKRWLKQLLWWDARSTEARRRYFALRRIVLVGGILIPVFTNLAVEGVKDWALRWSVTVLGVVVAISAGWEGQSSYGQIWLEKRRAAELLKVDGWHFFQLTAQYRGRTHAEAFPDFAAAVERRIAEEVGEYIQTFEESSGGVPSSSTKDKAQGGRRKR